MTFSTLAIVCASYREGTERAVSNPSISRCRTALPFYAESARASAQGTKVLRRQPGDHRGQKSAGVSAETDCENLHKVFRVADDAAGVAVIHPALRYAIS